LTTSLHGLQQSPLAWYQRLVTHFVQLGFSQTESNANIYVKKLLKEVSLFWQFIMWTMALLLAIIWRWHGWIKSKFEKRIWNYEWRWFPWHTWYTSYLEPCGGLSIDLLRNIFIFMLNTLQLTTINI
jgi:hypothetical protein